MAGAIFLARLMALSINSDMELIRSSPITRIWGMTNCMLPAFEYSEFCVASLATFLM